MKLGRAASVAAVLPLYTGPVLAGVIATPARALPAFVLVFLLWSILTRPVLTFGAGRRWTDPEPWARLAGTVAVQAPLVILCWWAGRALSFVLPAPEIPLGWPLAISLVSIPLCWLVFPKHPPEMDAVLDEALAALEASTITIDSSDTYGTETPEELELQATVVRAIAELPPDADVAKIAPLLAGFDRLLPQINLLGQLELDGDPHPPKLLAQAMLALDPDMIEACGPDDSSPAEAFARALASDNPKVIRQTADLATEATKQLGRLAHLMDLPPETEVLAAAGKLATAGEESAAHSLRAVYKARRESAKLRAGRPDD